MARSWRSGGISVLVLLLLVACTVGAQRENALWVSNGDDADRVVRLTWGGAAHTFLVRPGARAEIYRGDRAQILIQILTSTCQVEQGFTYDLATTEVLDVDEGRAGVNYVTPEELAALRRDQTQLTPDPGLCPG